MTSDAPSTGPAASSTPMIVTADTLESIVRRVLQAEGTRDADAALVAAHLVASNLTGHDSHGVARLPRYVNDIRTGGINVSADPHVVREAAGVVVFDADWGFGQVAVTRAFDILMERASRQGVAAAGVHHCNDTARLGAYVHAVAELGFFALMMVNDGGWEPMIAPWGGREALFSTNPIAAAAPSPDGPAFCADFSTSVRAGSAVKLAALRDEALPPDTILDNQGRPTTDPHDLFTEPRGSILPLGAPVAGHKGFALNLIVDVLCGAVVGAGCSGMGERDAQGVFALVIDIDAFNDRAAYVQHVQGLLDLIRAAPRHDGVADIRVPGETGAALRDRRLREGVEVDDPLWDQIRALATGHGLKVDP